MTTKDIRTSHAHTVCDVCGRTLLRGERAEIYINGGARRSVCELCKPRALHEGWIREGTVADYSQADSGSERGRSFLSRLRRGRDGGSRRSRNRPSLDDELSGRDWQQRQRPAPGTSGAAGSAAWDRPGRSAPPASARGDESAPSDPAEDAYWEEDEHYPYGGEYPSDDQLTFDGQEPMAEEPPGAGAIDDTAPPRPVAADPRDYWDADHGYEEPGADVVDDPPAPRRPWSRRPKSLGPNEGLTDRPRPSRRRPPSSGRPARRARPTATPGASDRRSMAREPRHVRAVPTSLEQKMAAAVNLFNQSEHRRTVAGVAKSLGGANVSVLPAADSPSLVHVVVCWELCWYRYAVDLSEEVPGVRVEGQGYELSELDETERMANAVADETGQLILR